MYSAIERIESTDTCMLMIVLLWHDVPEWNMYMYIGYQINKYDHVCEHQ